VKNAPLDSHTVTIYPGPIISSAVFCLELSNLFEKRLQTTERLKGK